MEIVPKKAEVIEFCLRLSPDGKMEVNVPKDAGVCLKIVSHFLMHISDHVQLKNGDSRIVIPKILVGGK